MLRDYQVQARDWLLEHPKALLALPMGTGKSLVALAAIEGHMANGLVKEPGIILAGASLKYQWQGEIAKWTDSRCIVVSGTPKKRLSLYEEYLNWRETEVDYLIMTYDTMSNDYNLVSQLPRGFVIADECVAIKGFRAKRSKRAKKLFSRTPVRIGLSGTPIENGKPEELYSIMELIDPEVLGSFRDFDSKYIVRNTWGWPERYQNLDELHRRMQQAMIRRSYDDPEISAALPREVIKDPIEVTLDPRTRKVMSQITRDIVDDLKQLADGPRSGSFDLLSYYTGTGSTETDPLRGMLMAKIIVARMLCDHPRLVMKSAQLFDDEDGGSSYAASLDQEQLSRLPAPKLAHLGDLVTDVLEENPDNKIVVFSCFRGMLDLIQEHFPAVRSVQYHGGMSAEERQRSKEQFQSDPQTRIFISSDAGGQGVDLPQANVLINYDMPWAAGALAQRNARPRRVSSTWEHIVIEQLLVKDSIEIWQAGLLEHKFAVSQAVLAGKGVTADGGVSVPLDSLLSHLINTP